MSAKRVAGGADVVSVSSLALMASLSRKTLLLPSSSTRRVPMTCHALLALWFPGGVGAWAATDRGATSTMIPTRSRRGSDRGRWCTDGAPRVKATGSRGDGSGRCVGQALCREDDPRERREFYQELCERW